MMNPPFERVYFFLPTRLFRPIVTAVASFRIARYINENQNSKRADSITGQIYFKFMKFANEFLVEDDQIHKKIVYRL